MNQVKTSQIENRNLIAYFVLAYLLSWSIGIPLALDQQEIIKVVT